MGFVILVWLACAIACANIASNKGRSGLGWGLLGFLFGPFALLFAVIAGKDRDALDREALRWGEKRRCPACAEIIQPQARLCPHCRTEVQPLPDRPQPRISLAVFLIGVFVAMWLLVQLAEFVTSFNPPATSPAAAEAFDYPHGSTPENGTRI